ncbi:putative NOD3 protein [Paratrimastix pyriformis]|uniref:NOD3 protein n=1 Tax=Paratrimastix pyriformis TaxID=342808 RepID=A0ABQ8UPE9_9EUKA|nr:putative NOD3 protein [Paratrimastix pyriformis]
MDFDTLVHVTSGEKPRTRLGDGSSPSHSYLVHQPDHRDRLLVLKQIYFPTASAATSALEECNRMMDHLQHPSILLPLAVRMGHPTADGESVVEVLSDYCSFGNMDVAMVKLNPAGRDRAARRLLEGLEFLTQNQQVHQNLKPTNVLFRAGTDGQPELVLADCGSALHAPSCMPGCGLRTPLGTLAFWPPELHTQHYYQRSDIFVGGLLLFCLFANIAPSRLASIERILPWQMGERELAGMVRGRMKAAGVRPAAIDGLTEMLGYNPVMRPLPTATIARVWPTATSALTVPAPPPPAMSPRASQVAGHPQGMPTPFYTSYAGKTSVTPTLALYGGAGQGSALSPAKYASPRDSLAAPAPSGGLSPRRLGSLSGDGMVTRAEMCTTDEFYVGGGFLTERKMQALAKALQSNTTITKLNFFNKPLSAVDIEILKPAFQARPLTELNLSRCGLTDPAMQHLAEALQTNNTLTKLLLSPNDLYDDGAAALAAILTHCPLNMVDVARNHLTNVGAQALSAALRGNTVLQELHLEENQIGEEGARALVQALAPSPALKRLCLMGNPIPPHVMEALKAQMGGRLC